MTVEKKMLILGSNSFAGHSLVNAALYKNYEILGISRSSEIAPVMASYRDHPNLDRFQFRQIDLNREWQKLCQLISEFKPEIVVDLAGQGMVAPSWINPEQWYQTNVVAKSKLHRFLTDQSFLELYVRISTPEVYGSTDHLIDETAAYNPTTPYAISHAAIDMNALAYHNQFGFPVMIGRFANFYGPGQQLYRIIPRAIIAGLGHDKLILDGGGKTIRAFIYGDDTAKGILAMIERGKPGEIFHFSPDDFISIKDLVEKIASLLNVRSNTFSSDGPERLGKDAAYFMNADKAKTKLGWSARTSLEEGLNKTVDWVRDNIQEILELPQHYIHQP